MDIDKTILGAIREAVARMGSQKALAEEAGIHRSKPGVYLDGKVASIPDRTWDKLWPVLVSYGGLDKNDYGYMPRSILHEMEEEEQKQMLMDEADDKREREMEERINQLGKINPCDHAPPWLKAFCRVLPHVPPGELALVQAVVEAAVKKCGHDDARLSGADDAPNVLSA